MREEPVLVTGATGYVGGRLVPRLLDAGYRVRAVVRAPEKLLSRPWAGHERLEVAKADLFDPAAMARAARGCFAAYYLVHSMGPAPADARGSRDAGRPKDTDRGGSGGSPDDFAEADRRAALVMAKAAAEAGLERIVYLGGLGDERAGLSKHLSSRHEVAHILQAGPVPVTYLRAAVILGAGSASFEILRNLAERLPVMVTPAWVRTRCQPISIRNVLGYLLGCLEHPGCLGQTFDIGGPDVVTYEELLQLYCEEARLPRRLILPVPVLSPTLSSFWVHLVTPVPASIARPLIDGLKCEVVTKEDRIRQVIPQELLGCRQTLRLALQRIAQEGSGETCWSDECRLQPPEWIKIGDAPYSGGLVLECGYRVRIAAPADELFEHVRGLGGRRGWHYGNLLWQARGLIDRLLGGAGLQRGRRHPDRLMVGDALDFWRVVDMQPPHRMRLMAEMRMPGEALLDFRLDPVPGPASGRDETEVVMLARFLPRGVLGLLYWYAVYPLHHLVFTGLLKGVAEAAGRTATAGPARFTPVFHFLYQSPSGKR
jgi:uncharacterized protein YbjT (DUF2867 family)